jgi:DNA-binding MarR family transcriptional regulator
MATRVSSAGSGATISTEEYAYVALLRAADRLEGEFADWLKPHGLSPTQYNALRILRGAGPEGLPCSEVGARMINRDPDITRLMDRLEKRALVRRSRGKADRRVVRASITEAGGDLLKGLDVAVSQFIRGRLGHLGPERVRELVEMLGELNGMEPVRGSVGGN